MLVNTLTLHGRFHILYTSNKALFLLFALVLCIYVFHVVKLIQILNQQIAFHLNNCSTTICFVLIVYEHLIDRHTK